MLYIRQICCMACTPNTKGIVKMGFDYTCVNGNCFIGKNLLVGVITLL